jgi:NADPH2:quinone reductase
MTTHSARILATGFGGPEVLSLQGVDLDEPGAHQVRIAVLAAGVNPADLKAYAARPGADPASLPMPLGYEAAGEVTAVGPDAVWANGAEEGPIAVGDEVIAFRVRGAYATDLVVAQDALVRKPPNLGWAEAGGLMLTGATATHLITRTRVGAGETVLVHGGSGGVGLMTVQLAALRGARVIATASESGHELLRELGAEPVTYGDGLLDRVRALAPDGVDVALDLVGTDEAMDVSLALVEDRDRIASIANFQRAPKEGIALLGGGPGADAGDEIRMAARPELARLAGNGDLRVVLAATYPLAEAARAHAQVATGHTTGKVILAP